MVMFRLSVLYCSQGSSSELLVWAFSSCKGSEAWAPVLFVAHNGVMKGLEESDLGAHSRVP